MEKSPKAIKWTFKVLVILNRVKVTLFRKLRNKTLPRLSTDIIIERQFYIQLVGNCFCLVLCAFIVLLW